MSVIEPATQIIANDQWIYAKQPDGQVNEESYDLRTEQLDTELASGQILVKAKYISVDPYMRIQQSVQNTWEAPHPLGVVQGSGMVGEVILSTSENFQVGDWVNCYSGWQKYAIVNDSEARKLDPSIAPTSTALGVLGMPGRIAYFGLLEAGKLQSGETVVVSGAAGAVGSIVVQIAKLMGCKVVAIAGSQSKVDFLEQGLGADVAINYNEHHDLQSMSNVLKAVCPEGIDVYYDNVGGTITDAVLENINVGARILICGQISQYNHGLDEPELGPRFLHRILYTRATIQGILARDYNHRMDEMLDEMGPWVKEGKIKYEETIIEGFENLPKALAGLFEGKNTGKMIVKLY